MLTVNDIRDKRCTREDFVFFWRHTGSAEACLSQWYPSPFVVGEVCYNCAEQYMMAEKARIFGDVKTLEQIMASYNPGDMKQFGRRVRNFNSYVWDANRSDVVMTASLAKFSQNPKLKEFLLSTGDKILVEASPYDRIWGIGLAADDADATVPARWHGDNRLGFILMAVRDMLRGEETPGSEGSIGQALSMWSFGAGNSARRFNMEDPMPEKRKRATADSWTTLPLEQFVTVPQDFYLTGRQMEVVRMGHIPDAMEDHWFMYCDDSTIRYYRSWTGICFAVASYEKSGDGYRITELRINNDPLQHELNDVDAAVALFYALLVSEYGGYSAPYWNAAFA